MNGGTSAADGSPDSSCPCSLLSLLAPSLSRSLRSLVGSRRGLPLAACMAAALPRRKHNFCFRPLLWCGIRKRNTEQRSAPSAPESSGERNSEHVSFWTHFLASVLVLTYRFRMIPIRLFKPQALCKTKNKKKKDHRQIVYGLFTSYTLAARSQRGIEWGADMPFCRSRGADKKGANGICPSFHNHYTSLRAVCQASFEILFAAISA